MKKFIMALSILAMGGSSFLGVVNQKELKEQIDIRDKTTAKAETTEDELNDTKEAVAKAREEQTAAEDARDAVSAQLTEAQREIKRQENTLMTMNTEFTRANMRLEEIKLAVKELDLDPNIKSIDDILKFEKERQDALAEAQNRTKEALAKNQTLVAEVGAQQTRVTALENHQVERAKTIALNGLEATVIAVNRNWGFVMVNAGKNLGVSQDSSMLVKRGRARIARLRIVSLEPEVLVADVVPESLAEGVRVLPGDKVIFENTK